MSYDFKAMLRVPKADAETLERDFKELANDEWAAYGRTVHKRMCSNGFEQALCIAMLHSKNPKDAARKVRGWLATGVIPS